MTTLRTIAGTIAAAVAGYALVRLIRSPEARADNPAAPRPPGCVADGTGPAGGKCDRCGRKLRNTSTRLRCDGGIVAYCGPKCAADWIDRNKTDLPEPPFWTPPAAKCCTLPIAEWNAEEMRGKRTALDQERAFTEVATGINWDQNKRGGQASRARILKQMAKEKRQLYAKCRAELCDGTAYIDRLEPWSIPVDVFVDRPNLWTFRPAQPWRGAPDIQVRHNKGAWKLQRNGRTISTADSAETIAAMAQAWLADRAPEDLPAIAPPLSDIDYFEPWGYEPEPPPDDDIPF